MQCYVMRSFPALLLLVSRTPSGHHEAADRCHGSGDQHDPGPAAGGLQGSESKEGG